MVNNIFPPGIFCVAPMLDWTDRHCRYFLRLITRHAYLYTEMITTGAILYGDRKRHLNFDIFEKPLALQLGGSEPAYLAQCAKIGEDYGYDEINLNVGCPSPRVKNGRFGACLMAEPMLVAQCIAAMRSSVKIPVTVKTRIGIDEKDSYEELHSFIETVLNAGCYTFVIHARKAWLHGLSPKENREIPPLRYDIVSRLVKDFPQSKIILNGGIETFADARKHLQHFAGVMVGRAVRHDPYFLNEVDKHIYQDSTFSPTRCELVERYIPYVEQQLSQGVSLAILTRPLLGLFQGLNGAKRWRRYISEHVHLPKGKADILRQAMKQME